MAKVSVIIPTYNRKDLLMDRALPSVINQTYGNLEILVIGDGTDQATIDALKDYPDTRVKFKNLPHTKYPEDFNTKWGVQALAVRNYGLDHATGLFIAMLDDDDSLEPDAIEFLLANLRKEQVDFSYGWSMVYKGEPPRLIDQRYGSWPPGHGAFCVGSFVYRAALNYRFDLKCIEHTGLVGDADMWTRMVNDGVKFHLIDHHVHNYFRNWP